MSESRRQIPAKKRIDWPLFCAIVAFYVGLVVGILIVTFTRTPCK